MYHDLTLDEDLALKKVISDRFSAPQGIAEGRFSWRDVLPTDQRTPHTDIIVTRGSSETNFSLDDVADAIGNSLTDLLIARDQAEESIFTDENRQFVSL